MTRTFNEQAICELCGSSYSLETHFEKWMRSNSRLDSRDGICRFDLDILLHRYKTYEDGKSSRLLQHMMFVEVKTYMAAPTAAQADTLYLLDQVMRNRKPNVHKKPRRQADSAPVEAYSLMMSRNVRLWMWGGHLLQLSSKCPESSNEIVWDKKHKIDVATLESILRFETDPDTLNPVDIRRRSRPFAKELKLPGF